MRYRLIAAASPARRAVPFLLGTIAAAGVIVSAGPARAQDHLLLTEFAVGPTVGEFFEIYNPTEDPIDLTNYYVSDIYYGPGGVPDAKSSYWRIVDRVQDVSGPGQYDFLARFPPGYFIRAGQSMVICMVDDGEFSQAWEELTGDEIRPDFELIQDGAGDGVPDMVDPGFDLAGRSYIGAAAGFSNRTDTINLFYWDGLSDLVQDVDMVQWSSKQNTFSTVSPNKTGQAVDGPDADTETTTYLPDTAPQGQDLASRSDPAHPTGTSVSRVQFSEGSETQTGGNGITGHDETSENYSQTWLADTRPSFGSPGEFGPPALLRARAVSSTTVDLTFSRKLDADGAGDRINYGLTRVESPEGLVDPTTITFDTVALDADGTTVHLGTGLQIAGALYEVSVKDLFSEDLTEELTPNSRAFFRGFSDAAELRLEVPRRPFVPHLDGQIEIAYYAPQGVDVLLRVFDPEGRERFILDEGVTPAGGLGVVMWDGRDDLRQKLPAGLYYLHLETPGTSHETVAPLVIGVAGEETLR